MVDVMLVLLVIFMITAPMLTAGVQVNLPNARRRRSTSRQQAAGNLDRRAGNVFLSEARVPMDQLEAKTAGHRRRSPTCAVYPRRHQARLRQGRRRHGDGEQLGPHRIALVTDRRENRSFLPLKRTDAKEIHICLDRLSCRGPDDRDDSCRG